MKLCQLRNMYVFRLDIDVCHKIFIQPAVAAVVVGWSGIVFIDAVDFHILERDITGLIPLDKFLVEGNR